MDKYYYIAVRSYLSAVLPPQYSDKHILYSKLVGPYMSVQIHIFSWPLTLFTLWTENKIYKQIYRLRPSKYIIQSNCRWILVDINYKS